MYFLSSFVVGEELAGPMLIPAGRSMLQHVGPQWVILSCSPGADHPSHSSAVTPCSEQPHVAEGPLQGCAFSWWQWGKAWEKASLKWLCYRNISALNLLLWDGVGGVGGGCLSHDGSRKDLETFVNMTVLKLALWMKALDITFECWDSQSLRALKWFKTQDLRVLAGVTFRARKPLFF